MDIATPGGVVKGLPDGVVKTGEMPMNEERAAKARSQVV
jgi:hypothetical protein